MLYPKIVKLQSAQLNPKLNPIKALYLQWENSYGFKIYM